MVQRRLANSLLGVLLWVISIHAGTFASDTLLPHPTGSGRSNLNHEAKESQNYFHLKDMKIPSKDLNRSITFGTGVLNRMLRLETSLRWSSVHVRKGTPSHGQLIVSSPDEQALEQGREAMVVTRATLHLMNLYCYKHGLSPLECSKYISSYSLTSTPLESSCKKWQKLCSREEFLSSYRSVDGTCNHRNDGSRGASHTAYQRLLYPDYLDGVQEPRRSVTKMPLPSPRLVSSTLVKKTNDVDNHLTLSIVQWGQFIEHDLSHTVTNKMIHTDDTIECCSASGSKLSPRYIHPLCAPIFVPVDDHYYIKHDLDCMTYVRSVSAFRSGCKFGPMEQMNQATHYLDGSQIYGSSEKTASDLRFFVGGQLDRTMKYSKIFLPMSHHPSEDCLDDSAACFESGDPRVNTYPQLTAMHTLWLREHNRISKELTKINPNWDDETLYQEARKIVIAEIQHITYNEWIPLVLGKKHVNKIHKYSEYNENINPSVSNSFATASIRVLNSLMDDKLKLYRENRMVNSSLRLRSYFLKPNIIEEPEYLDSLVRGLSTQPSQKLDFRFAEDMSSQLFSNGFYGYDVFSLDIQRGRDHGLPSYVTYRNLCGLPEVRSFEDLSDVVPSEVISSLSKVYENPHDIDLIVGGLSERPDADSLFGPTFSCIISDQFLRTRRGDRYFYTNEHQPAPFSKTQLQEIEKVTLARIFCDNGDDIKKMQPNVFKTITDSNQLVNCDSDDIPKMNLKWWLDSREKYY